MLRERTAELVAESCAWAVGLSDQPHVARRHGRVGPTGASLGGRAAAGLPLGGEEDARLEIGDTRPGSFRDALNALTSDSRQHADRFDDELLAPFSRATCVLAVERMRDTRPELYRELLDELGDDGSDLDEVVRTGEWAEPLRIEAEQLALAALGDLPLVDVEAEGLPLSLVRAAEAVTADTAPRVEPEDDNEPDELAGARFLAEAAMSQVPLPQPVPPVLADKLLEVLLGEGLEPEELLGLLPDLPVQQDTAEEISVALEARRMSGH
jgi:hypothetical protein